MYHLEHLSRIRSTRDVFLVEKEPGGLPTWVEQHEYGRMPNYDRYRVLQRRTIPINMKLPQPNQQFWWWLCRDK